MVTIVDAWNGPGNKDAELTKVQPIDNALHASAHKRAFEHWYFDAHLDSGHTVIGFFTKRRPEERAGCNPSVELVVYSPDGEKRQIRRSYPKDQARFSELGCDVRIGENSAIQVCDDDGTSTFTVRLAEEGVAYDLRFESELPMWMPGRGETYYGPVDHFGWCVGAPRAKVSGTLTIDGATIPVRGRGYADHNWGVGDMKRIIDRWHWGRLYLDDYSLIYASVLTQARLGGHMSKPLMLAKDGEVLLSTGEMEVSEGPMQFDPRAGRDYPTWLELSVPGRVRVRFDVERIFDAVDLLDEMPLTRSRPVKALVHRFVGRPGYFRFDSRFTLTVIDGDEEIVRTGRTLHEMVALS